MIVGIVGKPNVGKSAFFKALTLANAQSGNFPFTTIDANSAIGYVKIKDPAIEFGKKSNPREGYTLADFRFVPIQVIDVAGLVPGAHQGKGLGNKFLDDLRQADVLIHVIDLAGTTNQKGEPVPINSYDPAEDIKFLEEELDHWYFNIIQRNFKTIEKKIKLQDIKIEESLTQILSGLKINQEQILLTLQTLNLNKNNLSENLFLFSKKLREISKPILIAANKIDILLEENLYKKKLKKLEEQFPNYKIIPIAALYEYNLRQAHKNSIIEYINGNDSFKILDSEKLNQNQKKGLEKIENDLKIIKSTGVQESINYAVFDLLKIIPVFPGGAKLSDKDGNVIPDCFLMKKNSTALDFAYKLHTDFGKNFIKAIDIKTKMMVGKDHKLKFSDIIEIISGK